LPETSSDGVPFALLAAARIAHTAGRQTPLRERARPLERWIKAPRGQKAFRPRAVRSELPSIVKNSESPHRFHSVQTTDVHVCDPKISDGRVSVLDYATTPVFLSLRLDEQTLFSVVRFGLVSPAG
jgi:hypothetical protein